MLRPNTITVATIAVCGVTLALGASVAVLPRVVPPFPGVTLVAEEPLQQKLSPRQIPHKFMRGLPSAQ